MTLRYLLSSGLLVKGPPSGCPRTAATAAEVAVNRATLGHGIDDSCRLYLALRLPERGHYGRYDRAYDRGRADVAAAAEVEHPEADVGRIEQRPVETVSRMTL